MESPYEMIPNDLIELDFVVDGTTIQVNAHRSNYFDHLASGLLAWIEADGRVVLVKDGEARWVWCMTPDELEKYVNLAAEEAWPRYGE